MRGGPDPRVPAARGSGEPGAIRVLPPDLPGAGGGTTGGSKSSPSPTQPPDRRWIPLAAVAVGIAVLAAVGVFQGQTPDPEEEDVAADTPGLVDENATTTTAAATFAVPPALDTVSSVLFRPGEETTGWAPWFSGAAAPSTPVTWGADSVDASLDSTGRLVMAITSDATDTLWVGRPPYVAPGFIDVRGAAWHQTRDAELAFVGREPGAAAYRLYTGTGNRFGGITPDLVDLGPAPARSELVAWGDWGFALSRRVAPAHRRWEVTGPGGEEQVQLLHVTVLLDPEGRPVRSLPGIPIEVGPNGELVLLPRVEAYEAARASGVTDRELGMLGEVFHLGGRDRDLSVVVLGPDQEPTNAHFRTGDAELAARAVDFRFTPDGSAVLMLAGHERGLEVTATWLDSNHLVRTIVDADRAVGLSGDGRYLIAQDDDSGDLLFHDWARGWSDRVPFELGPVLALDL